MADRSSGVGERVLEGSGARASARLQVGGGHFP